MHKICKRFILAVMAASIFALYSPAEAVGLNWSFPKNKTAKEKTVKEKPVKEKSVKVKKEKKKKKKKGEETVIIENGVQQISPDEGEKPLVEELHDDYVVNDDGIVYVKSLEIFGNNIIDTDYIRDIISSREGHIYDRKEITKDLNNLYATGYFNANIRAVPMRLDDGSVRLRIVVEENPPVTGLAVVGNNSVPTSDIKRILSLMEGKPQNLNEIKASQERVEELYASRGYKYAKVRKITDEADGVITFYIDEGIIENITVVGNNKTKDFIVKRNILSAPGEVYNENVLRSDIMRLMGTQAFKNVEEEVVENEETGMLNVKIVLNEQKTGRIGLGVGVDSGSGFFGSVSFGENNFRGLGQKINLNVMAGTGILMDDNSVVRRANWQAELGFLEPHFKKEGQSLGFRAFIRSFGSYQVPLAIEKRYGGDITLARVFEKYPRLTGSISLGAENVNLSEGDASKIINMFAAHGLSLAQRSKELEGGFYIKAIPSIVYDTRDNPINPRHGLIARASLEENFSLSGASTFGKIDGAVRKYIPAGKKSAFLVTAKAGGTLNGTLPEFAMYSLGGPYSVRGFNMSEVGMGKGYMLGSVEYRTPIPFLDRITRIQFLNNLRIAAFVDSGKVFSHSLADRLYNRPGYAITAGVGLRIFIPGMGAINLDYGFPLTNTKGSRSSGFFTFGMGDML